MMMSGGTYDSQKADVWSCGVTLFEMCTGSVPFKPPPEIKHSLRISHMQQMLKSGEYRFPPDVPLSDELKALIRGMLATGKLKRNILNAICSADQR
jgi:serine/threonine protein kinase